MITRLRLPAKMFVTLLGVFLAIPGSAAEHKSARPAVFDLPLGARAADLPDPTRFADLSCGNNGGPSTHVVVEWTAFSACPRDADGLYEIAFRYDDEDELVARALGRPSDAWGLGTSIDYFPVVLSVLFTAAGRLVGLRIITDHRYDPKHDKFLHLRPRNEHYLLGLYLMERFGMTEANCRELPVQGETPVLGMFMKRECEQIRGNTRYTIDSRLLRRHGAGDVDPVMGTLTDGQFISETRAEMRLISPGWNKDTLRHRVPLGD